MLQLVGQVIATGRAVLRARAYRAAPLASAAVVTAYSIVLKFITTKSAGVGGRHLILVGINPHLVIASLQQALFNIALAGQA